MQHREPYQGLPEIVHIMPVLVRELTSKRGNLWAKAEDKSLWTKGQFPYELLQDLSDTTGALSFYEVKSRRDPALIRIAAALNFPAANSKSKPQLSCVDFRTIDTADVQKLGLTVTATEGLTKDAGVNSLHREITGLTGPIAVRFARVMCQRSNVPFSAEDIAGAIAQGIRRGHLPQDALHKDMLRIL